MTDEFIFPVTGGPGPAGSNAVFNAPAYFLSLFDRRFPYEYLQPLKVNTNSGYELFNAIAETFSRSSRAVERLETGCIIMFSSGGLQSEVSVEFYRPTNTAGAVTLAAGSVVSCSISGRRFRTLTDAVFSSLAFGPIPVVVRAIAQSWQYDVAGRVITPVSAITLEGEIDTIAQSIQINPTTGLRDFIDGTLLVRNINSAVGGRAAMLDGLGSDRGVLRGADESDDVYRYRVRALPDTISPAAIIRALNDLRDAWGVDYSFVEVFQREYQTAWDFPSSNVGVPNAVSPYPTQLIPFEGVFTFDDPRPAYPPFQNRWLDAIEFRGAFFVVVKAPQCISEYGQHYDSTDSLPVSRLTANGPTPGFFAISAYDLPAALDVLAGVAGTYDGFDVGLSGFWQAWWDTLQTLKAAGVVAVLELQGE